MDDPDSYPLNSPAGTRGSWLLVAALTLAALLVRLHSIDFALPYFQESDPHIFEQVDLLRQPHLDAAQVERASIYPHLLARTVLLFEDPLAPPADPAQLSLAEHLEHAGGLHVLVRTIVACFSVLLIPVTWLIARRFFDTRWALFATALSATSLLALQFGQMARPHGFAAPLAGLAVAAAVRLRNRPNLGSYVLVGLAVGAALAALQSALAVLIPFAVAFVLRDREQRRWFEPRVLVTLGLIAGFIRVFWPFAFGESSSGESARIEDGTIHLSAQTMSFAEFTGEGFRTVWMTFWYYETTAFLLCGLGVAVWCARALRGKLRSGHGRDLLVVLSYVLPYLIVVSFHERAQQRFVIQLVPLAACGAAFGLRAISGRHARVAMALALSVPLIATGRFAWLRAEGHTLGQAAQWLRENADPETDRIGVHLTFDLPFARRAENLFQESGEWRKGIFTPWQFHQVTVMGPDWPGERWFLHSLYVPAEIKPPEVQADPEAYLRRLELDYVILPGEHGASFHPMLQAVRAAAANIGTLVFEAPRGERMIVKEKIEGLDTPHFTAFVLTSPGFGPKLEIYRLDRERGER